MHGFKKFLLRGNVVDLAIAVAIGAAFTAVVTAFNAAFISPLIDLATGSVGDFSKRKFSISTSDFLYGQFIQSVVTFLITAAVLYFLVLKPVQRLMDRYKTEPEPSDPVKDCPECLSKIPAAAKRCAYCTAEQPVLTA